jgi:general secretion pathway protein J
MKSEIRMTKSKRNPNDEIQNSHFGNSFVIRHSSFVISSAGFTLMEMLLALAVSAIVIAAIGGVFYSALRLRNSAAAALDETAPLHQTLALLRRDLQGALPPTGLMASNFTVGALSGGMGQNSALQFSTSTGVMRDDAPWGDIQQVAYELRSSNQAARAGGNDLYRVVTRNLLGTTPQPNEQFLMGNVQTLEFSCYDGANWLPTWDTSMGNTNLPTAVRVRIQLAVDNNVDARSKQPIEMVVPLVSLSRTNQISGSGGGQ